MPLSKFIHLRVYSDYSLGHGAVKIKDLVKQCIKDSIPAVALTDKDNLFAALEFSMEASKNGIQPIVGIDVTVCNQHKHLGKILLLAQDNEGFQNLLKIASYIHLDKKELNTPNIRFEELLKLNKGLIAICAGHTSSEYIFFRDKKLDYITDNLNALHQAFESRLYIDICRHSELSTQDIEYEEFIINQAYEHNIPLVATNYVAFLKPDMHEAQDVLTCIVEGRYLIEDNRVKISKDFYFKSTEEMASLFADLPEAIENTVHIAKRCHVMAEVRPPLLPSFTKGLNISEAEVLKSEASAGLEKLIPHITDEALRKTYFDRLEFELSVINKMQYGGYFLIVSDFIKWSKAQGIPVGPGRGSGAGSVVAWALQITDLDPLKFGLLFERFLNPDRVSMPDFDIDFCQERREEVIEYVKSKYGSDKVANIITFGKLQARAVLRDVGRVLHMPYNAIDKICKMVPNNPANPITLKGAIELDKDLQKSRDNDPQINKLLSISLQLEGLNRHISTHAAGIVIADRPIIELVPLYQEESKKDISKDGGMLVVQYPMKYAEGAGLVKFDFLGLKTLTVIDWTCKLIKNKNIKLDINKVPLDDEKTYALLSKGDTIGVFQFEGAGMTAAIKKLKPDNIEDLIALGSLYRPGPMDNIPSYINRKHGLEKPKYLHPLLGEILKETYGIIVYQEQVMEIARVLAGYTLSEADLLRRAMGKKIKDEMEAQREVFINGCLKNNIDKANDIFALIEKFASYGFNKSHAAAYALISYQTAYLKANFPIEFLTASINLEINDTDKINLFIHEAKKLNIKIFPPSINHSCALFTVEDDGIRFGLGAIKNVGVSAIEDVVRERNKNGPFESILDFVERCSGKLLNKRMIEGLAKVQAFHEFEKNNRLIFENAEVLVRYAARYSEEKDSKQVGLFTLDDQTFLATKPKLSEFEEWNFDQKLAAEFEGFGFYLSSHPLESYSIKLSKMNITESINVEGKAFSKAVKLNIAGVITSKKIRSSQKGKYAFIQLSDRSGLLEISVFNEDLLIDNDNLFQPGRLVFIKADVRIDNNGLRVVIDNILSIEDATKDVESYLNIHAYNDNAIQEIASFCGENGKRFSLTLHLNSGEEIVFNSTVPRYLSIEGENLLRQKDYIKIVEV